MSSSPAPSAFGSCGRRETARASGNRSRGLSRVSDQELAPPAAPPGRRSAGKQRRTVTYGDSTLLRQLVRQRVRRRGGFRRSCIVLAFYLVRPRLEEREKRCQNRSASARASVALVTISHSLWKRTRLSHPRGGVRRIEVARAWGTIRVLTSSRCLPFHCRPAGLRKARSNRFALPRPPWFPERLSDFDGLDFPPRGTKMKEAWSTEVESEVCYNGNKSIQSLRVETHARALRHLPSSSISGFS